MKRFRRCARSPVRWPPCWWSSLVVALTTDRFLDAGNLTNLVLQVSIIAIVAIGSTIVIFTGGIDLSPGLGDRADDDGLRHGGQALGHRRSGAGSPGRARARRCCSALLNGVLTAYLRIPSFITTLAALSAFRGVAFMFNNGSPVFSVSPQLEPIFYGTVPRHTAAALLRGGALRAALLVPALHRRRARRSTRWAATRTPRGCPASTCAASSFWPSSSPASWPASARC